MHPYVTEAARPSRLRRLVGGTVLILVIAALVLHAVGGWMVASWIGSEVLVASHSGRVDDGAVIGMEGDRLTIRPADGADADIGMEGVIGFVTDASYIRLGEVIDGEGDDIIRTYEVLEGAQVEIGVFGDVDLTARPMSALGGLCMQESSYESPLGEMDAWAIDGSDTWVIHVHDHNNTPDQALRNMAVLASEGVSQMAIAYRNDTGQPQSTDGRFTFGVGERDDLAAAIAHAREVGASRVVLYGYGSGAAIVLAEMYRDVDIAGAVLDSPVLDAESSVRFQAANSDRGIIGAFPGTVSAVGSILASMRYGVAWDTVDYLSRVDQLAKPVLIFHGDADDVHPIDDSRLMADERPELVRLVEIPDAGADLAWNVDPSAYELNLLSFLDDVRSGG